MGTLTKGLRLNRPRQLLVFGFVAILILLPGCRNKSITADGPMHLEMKVSPERPSMNKPVTFLIQVTGSDGQPVNDADVNGALTMKLMDMGATQLKFTPKGSGDYEASVKSLDMSGPWGLAITARHGGATAKQDFDVNIFD